MIRIGPFPLVVITTVLPACSSPDVRESRQDSPAPAVAIEPSRGRLLAARRLELEGRPREALHGYLAVLEHEPANADALERALAILAVDERWDAAFELSARALDARPHDARIARLRGILALRADRPEEARTALEAAARLDPAAEGPELRARRLELEGDLEHAATAYLELLAADPADRELLGRAVALLSATGRTPEAIDACNRALAEEPRAADVYRVRGELALAEGRVAAAEADFERAAELGPGGIEGDWQRARSLLDLGRWAEAATLLRRVHAARPDDHEVTSALGWALLQEHSDAEALEVLARAEALAPAGSTIDGERRGFALLRMGRAEEALALFDGLVALAPEDPSLHAQRGMVLRTLGRIEDARSAFEAALALDSGQTAAARALRELPPEPVGGRMER